MAVDTVEDFFAVLEKSGLLTAEQSIDSRLAAGRDPARRNDPRAIAKALARKGLVTRWQAGQLLAGRSSFFLGKYKLIEPIGRGGMGSVFLAEHTTMNRRVALKILSRQVGKDPASLERFLDEARAVAAVDHPNIVQAYSVDHDADRYYLVMEYVDGRDLKRLVEEEGLPDYQTAADYIRQAADGLAHGHAQNMIHCDVKPSNLLVNDQGQVKIVDMGLTRLNGREQEEGNGEGERVLGSVDYLAPEQALERSDFDHRADIYSLGCTLYFLLTGHPPFPEGTLSERIVKHQMQQPRSIHRERADAPPGLVRICERMMAKRAEDRFQSAEEVSSVLAEWQLREPKHKRIVPLKTAQPLDGPAEGRLPKIDVDAELRPTSAIGGSANDTSKSVEFFRTRRQKIVALVVAGLAVATVAAAAAALLIGLASAPSDPNPTGTGSSEAGAEKNGSADTRSTRLEEPPDGRNVPPPEKPPADDPSHDKPPPDQPPEENTPDEKPPADPRQADTPQTDRRQTDKPEPKEQKSGPQDPGEKPQEPQDKDPLGGLATSVDLPVLPAKPAPDAQPSVPVSLGKLQLAPTAALDIELKGGNDVVPGKRHLALGRDQDGGGWVIHLDAEGKQETDGGRTDLARIWLDEQTLKFQWLDGVGRSRGDYLRSCGLLVRTSVKSDGEHTRWLPLCRPKTVDPLMLDLDSGVTRSILPRTEWMPKVGKLRLQVTGLEGPFPEHAFMPLDGISENGLVEVLLSGEKLPDVALHVKLASRGRAARVEVSAVFRLPGQAQLPFKSAEAIRLTHEFYRRQNFAEKTLEKLKDGDPRRPDVERQLDLLKDSLEGLQALSGLYHRIHGTGKIHFRVFRAVDDRQIELFATQRTAPNEKDRDKDEEDEEH